MTKLGLKYISYVAIFFVLSEAMDTIQVDHKFSILILGFALLLVNMLIKPLLLLITLPASILTFGLFTLIVNTWTIMLADFLVPDIRMGSFFNSFIAAILILLVNQLLLTNKSHSKFTH